MGFDLKTRIEQIMLNLKQLKSLEILQSAREILTSNNKYVLLMVFSSIPFFIFMVFFAIKLQKTYSSQFPLRRFSFFYIECSFDYRYYVFDYNINEWKGLHLLLQLSLFYLVVYPLVKLLSSSIIIKIAAKIHAGEKESTLKEMIDEVLPQMNGIFKGSLSTAYWVHLLSTSTLLGLFWIPASHFIISALNDRPSHHYDTESEEIPNGPFAAFTTLSAGVHGLIFVLVLYKYLDWSALWNMSIVISVLEEETGIEAIEMSSYYGKRCRRTGIELMLGFFTYGTILMLPCVVVVEGCNLSIRGILFTATAVGFVCLGNLVKWVTFVLYFYDCKAQTMQKKVDEEVGKLAKG